MIFAKLSYNANSWKPATGLYVQLNSFEAFLLYLMVRVETEKAGGREEETHAKALPPNQTPDALVFDSALIFNTSLPGELPDKPNAFKT